MTTPPSSSDLSASFLDDYFAECEEHMVIVRKDLLALEVFVDQSKVDQKVVEELFRSFHTLKGLSGMVGLQPAEMLSHKMESYLRLLRKKRHIHKNAAMDALMAGARLLEQVIGAFRAKQPLPNIDKTLADLDAFSENEPSSSPSLPEPATSDATVSLKEGEGERLAAALSKGLKAWRLEFMPSAALSERGITVSLIRSRIENNGEIISAAPRVLAGGQIIFQFLVATDADASIFTAWQSDGITAQPYEATDSQESADHSEKKKAVLSPANVVRVDVARLDEVMRLVGELVVTRSRMMATAAKLEAALPTAAWRDLSEVNHALERQLRSLRESVMRMRMVPIGETFARMQFVVRDLLKAGDKKVHLQVTGQETEIDKYLVERLMDPLLHLVRNAISHGLETAQERQERSKPVEGLLVLKAMTSGDTVILQVEDDGRGIDRDHVLRKAKEQGLAVTSSSSLDDSELLSILCAPGFSTRQEADLVSGRGVGMAVVRNIVQELGGQISLWSEVGKGTRFTIEVPLTLAILEALIARAGNRNFAFPLSSVQEAIEITPGDISIFEHNEIISYRGGVLPLFHLVQFTDIKRKESARPRLYALVISVDGSAVGILVDKVVGQREIVVHALTDDLVRVPGVAGATQLGDGQIVLILDGPQLARTLRKNADRLRPRMAETVLR